MCLDRSLPAKCRGFLLPSAIFLLVVMAGLAAFLVNISNSQHIGSAQDVVGTRAYHAARSGLEWGFYQALLTAACPLPVAGESVPLDATAFPGLSLTVRCDHTSATEAGLTTNFYTITATACTQPNAVAPFCPNTTTPSPMYVERQLQALVER